MARVYLNGFDDLRRYVASKSETSGGRVEFHDTTQCLLCSRSHTVCLVEKNDLVKTLRKGNLLLSEQFDLLSDDINASSSDEVW